MAQKNKESVLAYQCWPITEVLHVSKGEVRDRHDRYRDIWHGTRDCYKDINNKDSNDNYQQSMAVNVSNGKDIDSFEARLQFGGSRGGP